MWKVLFKNRGSMKMLRGSWPSPDPQWLRPCLNPNDFLKFFIHSFTRSHNVKLTKPICNTNLYLNLFSKRLINAWNKLPSEVVNASCLSSFVNSIKKISLYSLYLKKVAICFFFFLFFLCLLFVCVSCTYETIEVNCEFPVINCSLYSYILRVPVLIPVIALTWILFEILNWILN